MRPTGWLAAWRRRDLHGFVGRLDRLVPDLIVDDIYGRDRLTAGAAVKYLVAMTEVDLEDPEQFLWWNSKTQSHGAVTTHFAASTVRSSARYAAVSLRAMPAFRAPRSVACPSGA